MSFFVRNQRDGGESGTAAAGCPWRPGHGARARRPAAKNFGNQKPDTAFRRYGAVGGIALTKENYRDRAAECLRLANEATNPRHRASLLEMAQAWMRLSDQAERNSLADLSYETPPRSFNLDDEQMRE